jgi:two-component system response regulator WspF
MKIGIVNDSSIAAEALRRTVALAPEHEVIWMAGNGQEAVDFCARMRPDLVLMDLIMPVMDGVEATRRIMTRTPCTILIVTANVASNAALVFEAMGCGALDAVDTPVLAGGKGQTVAEPLLAKIALIGKLIGTRSPALPEATPVSRHGLVAIGASAGGPAAIAAILEDLPANFPAAVVVVQHVDERFAAGMADWLNIRSVLPVRLAAEGDPLKAGTVLLAGTHNHLVLKSAGRLGYTSEPSDSPHRPAIDVFFCSVSRQWRGSAIGVLLTGMGRDGAAGLKAMHDHGYHTIAQDQATSAVYGMPKAAAALGAALEILPLQHIGRRLREIVSGAS